MNNYQRTLRTRFSGNRDTEAAASREPLHLRNDYAPFLGPGYDRELLEHAQDALIVIDDEECCVDVNVAACTLFGVERRNLIGTYIISDLVGLEFDGIWQTLSWDKPTCGELQLTRSDGAIRHVEFKAIANFASHLHVLILRDITTQKSVEHHHQSLQDQFETFFELSLDLLAIANGEGFFVHLNPAWEHTLGFTIDELTSVCYLEFVHPDDRVLTHQAMKQLMIGQSVTSFENRYRTKDGDYRWLSWRLKPDSSNQLIYATVRDVTAQKEAEHQLQQRARQEETFNRVVQVIHYSLDLNEIFSTSAAEIAQLLDGEVAIVQYLPSRACWVHRIVYDRGEEMLPKVDSEIPDKDNPFAARLKNLEIVRIDDTDTIDDPINRDLAKSSPGSWLLTPISIDGEVWGSLTLGRSRQNQQSWKENEINLAQGVANQLAIAIQQSQLYQRVQNLNTTLEAQVVDRTAELQTALDFESALKRITDKVRDSLDETQILQAAVEELASMLDVDCCDTSLYNDDQTISTIIFEISKGWPSIQGQSFLIQDSPNPHMHDCLHMGQECQACNLNQGYVRHTAYPTAALAVPIFDDQRVLGDLWLFKPADQVFNTQEIRLVRQVANQCAIALRQARLYQTAQRQVTELKQLNQMKDEILSMVSHDLRSPMANIKMVAEMLQLSLKRLCVTETESNTNVMANMERYIQILSRECQRETELLNDLLDLARIESGNVQLESTAIHLKEWIQSLLDVFSDRLKSRHQHLQISVPSDLLIHTDLFCLERIVSELLHNACKYTPADGRIWVTARSVCAAIELSVCNSGVEISPEECNRIFDKFYRIPDNDPWKQGGTGLGLALSKELVHRLQGNLCVRSSQNQTCFTITLPTQHAPVATGDDTPLDILTESKQANIGT